MAAEVQPAEAPPVDTLQLIDTAHQQVQLLRVGAGRLLESLAAASSPSDTSHQVEALLAANTASLQAAKASFAQLEGVLKPEQLRQPAVLSPAQREAVWEQRNDASATRATSKGGSGHGLAACQKLRSALQALEDAAGPAGGVAPMDAEPTDVRQAQASALQTAVSRAASITGLPVAMHTSLAASAPLPASDAAQASTVRMACGDAWTAVVALSELGAPRPLRVALFSAAEAAEGRAGPWSQSEHLVFRRISALGMQAMHHFSHHPLLAASAQPVQPAAVSPAQGAAQLVQLLLWLATYSDLFTRKCAVTGTLLATDEATQHLLPPVVRRFDLPLEQLVAAAQDPALRRAYHPYAAPKHAA